MWDKVLATLIQENRGKTIGVGLALIVSILFVTLGFWKTMFIVICIAVGYFVGKKLDENEDFDEWTRRLFRNKDYRS